MDPSSKSIRISDAAYCKCVLHGAKYTSAIGGFLLGRRAHSGQLVITDALPLGHSPGAIFTSALAESALFLADALCASQNISLVGVYFANAVATDRSIGVVPTRLADAIRTRCEGSVLLMLEAPRLSPARRVKEHCFRVCVRGKDDSTWARGARDHSSLQVSERALKKCDEFLKDHDMVHSLVDFEDHCADPSMDWLNRDLFQFDTELAYIDEKDGA